MSTVKKTKISDTPKFAVVTLKVEKGGFTLEKCVQKMQREFDLGLHCLPRPICPKT